MFLLYSLVLVFHIVEKMEVEGAESKEKEEQKEKKKKRKKRKGENDVFSGIVLAVAVEK